MPKATIKRSVKLSETSGESETDIDDLLRKALNLAAQYVSSSQKTVFGRDSGCTLVRYELKEGLYRRYTSNGKSCNPELQGHADLTLIVEDPGHPQLRTHQTWRFIVATKRAGIAETFKKVQQLRAWSALEKQYLEDVGYFGIVTDCDELRKLAEEQGFRVLFIEY